MIPLRLLACGLAAQVLLLLSGCVSQVDPQEAQEKRNWLSRQVPAGWPSLPVQTPEPLAHPDLEMVVSDRLLQAYVAKVTAGPLYVPLLLKDQKVGADGVLIDGFRHLRITDKNTLLISVTGRAYFRADIFKGFSVRTNLAVDEMEIELAPRAAVDKNGRDIIVAAAAVTKLQLHDLRQWPELNRIIAQLATSALAKEEPTAPLPDADLDVTHPTMGHVVTPKLSMQALFIRDGQLVLQKAIK